MWRKNANKIYFVETNGDKLTFTKIEFCKNILKNGRFLRGATAEKKIWMSKLEMILTLPQSYN